MAPGWADVRQALITAAEGCADAVQLLARDPDDSSALRMAQLSVSLLEDLRGMVRRVAFDEAVIEAERERAIDEYRAGTASVPPPRRRYTWLRVVNSII